SDIPGEMPLVASLSSAGSYSTLLDRISRSSCSIAWRAWSLLRLRSVCLATLVWTVHRMDITAVTTIPNSMIATTSSTVVKPCSSSGASAGTGRRRVGGLGQQRAEVDLHGEVGDHVGAVG